MKSFKIKSLLVLSLFISQYNFFQTSVAQSKLTSLMDNTEDILLSGWKPRNVFSKKGITPDPKTIEALNKFKKIPALKPYFKKAKGMQFFQILAKQVLE